MISAGAAGAYLVEQDQPTVNSFIAGSWVKEKLDLTELARLRWKERWSVIRLAAHYRVSKNTIKQRLQAIRRNPKRVGFKKLPSNIRIRE